MVSIAYSIAALSNDNKQSLAYNSKMKNAENNMDHVNRLNENKYTTRKPSKVSPSIVEDTTTEPIIEVIVPKIDIVTEPPVDATIESHSIKEPSRRTKSLLCNVYTPSDFEEEEEEEEEETDDSTTQTTTTTQSTRWSFLRRYSWLSTTIPELPKRYPIHIESIIYRLSTMRLSDPGRPLRDQLLTSNMLSQYHRIIIQSQNELVFNGSLQLVNSILYQQQQLHVVN
ncbi:hypothetical protein BD770DRAFT_472731 [Pilaira anomala]|nr:hypothetical protein BD770DRAFT_472731 [Pilaira anomala]